MTIVISQAQSKKKCQRVLRERQIKRSDRELSQKRKEPAIIGRSGGGGLHGKKERGLEALKQQHVDGFKGREKIGGTNLLGKGRS